MSAMNLFSAFVWKYMERCGCQIVQFALQIILARLLAPTDFGVVALISVFINIALVFVNTGLGTALIQAQKLTAKDISSVLYANVLVSIILYAVLFFMAPTISDFYNIPELSYVVRILSIMILLGSINSIQNAILVRDLRFKLLFYTSSISISISAVIGIILAYDGYGVWALVWQQLSNQIAICIILCYISRWKFGFNFSFVNVKRLYSFGWKLLASSLLDTVYRESQSLLIGKIFTSADLGFYNRGKTFPMVIVGNIDGSIQGVLLPALSRVQNDLWQVKDLMRKSIMASVFVISPLMIIMLVVADSMVRIVLTEKWLPCVPFLRICCISFIFYPIHTANLTAINALGKSDVFLKLEIAKKIIGVVLLFIAAFIFKSIIVIAWSAVVSGAVSTFINAYPNKKLINYSYSEQIKDILPIFVISALMGLIVFCLGCFIKCYPEIWGLLAQFMCGGITYFLLARLMKIPCLNYLLSKVTIQTLKK